MRSINSSYLKVEGNNSLVRDMSSGAIVRTDDIDYENYRRKKEAILRQNKMIEEQKKEIESLKSDLDEIKQMLNVILKAHR